MLVEMEVVHISMEEMTMTVMLLAMWCSYFGSGRALDDSDDLVDGNDTAKIKSMPTSCTDHQAEDRQQPVC